MLSIFKCPYLLIIMLDHSSLFWHLVWPILKYAKRVSVWMFSCFLSGSDLSLIIHIVFSCEIIYNGCDNFIQISVEPVFMLVVHVFYFLRLCHACHAILLNRNHFAVIGLLELAIYYSVKSGVLTQLTVTQLTGIFRNLELKK